MASEQHPTSLKEPPRQQCADAVLMVRPKAFGFNPETAATNTFQKPPVPGAGDAAALAAREFDGLARALAAEGVEVCVAEDSQVPVKPDAVFPNNWVSFHADGTLVLYPMQAASRRAERRQEVIDAVVRDTGLPGARTSWTSPGTRAGQVPGRHRQPGARPRRAPRLRLPLAAHRRGAWRASGRGSSTIEPMIFDGHTMPPARRSTTPTCACAIGSRVAVVALEAIAAADRERVLSDLTRQRPRRHRSSAARNRRTSPATCSSSAPGTRRSGTRACWSCPRPPRRALAPRHVRAALRLHRPVLAVPVPTIERHGGGSVRCMLAEVFLLRSPIAPPQGAARLSARLAWSGSLVVGRLRGGVDIRTLGSGNAGATNALRTQGKVVGLAVLVIDLVKGWLATAWLAHLALPLVAPAHPAVQAWSVPVCALAVMLGHVYPACFGFRGGKGVATLVGRYSRHQRRSPGRVPADLD